MKLVFVAVIFVWLFFGFLGVYFNASTKDTGVKAGVFFGLFCAMVPALPLIANLCGLI